METHFENLAQAQGLMARERVLEDLKSLARIRRLAGPLLATSVKGQGAGPPAAR
jgi:hypothetical protein